MRPQPQRDRLRVLRGTLQPRQLLRVDNGLRYALRERPQSRQHITGCNDGLRCTVLKHEVKACLRVGRIEWHIGTPCLQYGQQCNHQIGTTLKRHGHTAVRHDALFDKPMSQLVGGLIEGFVGVMAFCCRHRDRIGCLTRLRFEQPV